jgi:hypothetical protein
MDGEVNGHSTLADLWPEAAKHLAPAVERWGTHTLEHVRAAIDSGDAQLWPMAEDGAIVSEIFRTPTGKLGCRIWLAGGNMRALLAGEKIVAGWAAEQGCEFMEILGRKGWQRVLPEYEPTAVILRRWLKEHE